MIRCVHFLWAAGLATLLACAARNSSPGGSAARIEPVALPPLVVRDAGTGAPTRAEHFEPRETLPGVTQIGPYEYRVERGTIDSLLENSAEMTPGLRIVPEQQGNHTEMRLFFKRADALPVAFGIRSGDAIVTVNDFDLSTSEQALEAYASIRKAPLVRLVVRRDDTLTTLVYHVE